MQQYDRKMSEYKHKESRCYRCGAKIYWAKTIMRKYVPVDPEAVILNGTMMYGNVVGENDIIWERGEIGDQGYMSHFDSCKARKNNQK